LRTSMVVVVALALALAAGTLMADPYVSVWDTQRAEAGVTNTWTGSTGLVMVPTATTVTPQGVVASYNWIDTDPSTVQIWNANVGITPSLEVGASRFNGAATGSGSELIGNAKYNLDLGRWTKNPTAPQLAIGVFDASNEVNRAYYVVLTKDLTIAESGKKSNLRASFGYADNHYNSGVMDGFFGGVEFVPFSKALLQIDYDGDNVNAALRYRIADQISVSAAAIDGDLGLSASFNSRF
jgi:hypothetical protein